MRVAPRQNKLLLTLLVAAIVVGNESDICKRLPGANMRKKLRVTLSLENSTSALGVDHGVSFAVSDFAKARRTRVGSPFMLSCFGGQSVMDDILPLQCR